MNYDDLEVECDIVAGGTVLEVVVVAGEATIFRLYDKKTLSKLHAEGLDHIVNDLFPLVKQMFK